MKVMLYAGASTRGGLLAHLIILARGLASAGHRVHAVISPDDGVSGVAGELATLGAAVTRLTVRGRTDAAAMLRLSRLVAHARPDVFHLHLSSPIEAIPALMAARLGGPGALVATEHAPTWFPLRRPWSLTAKKAAVRALDAVIAVCRSDARFLQETFGLSAGLITVIPNGVPPAAPAPPRAVARARLGLPAGDVLVAGYAGALEEKKGVLDLLEASRAAGLPDLVVALAGEGSLGPELRKDPASGRGVVLAGHVEPITGFLAALDLFVLPSHQEAMPLALLEAMQAGLPIVAARVGGIPEAIQDGVTGLLVDPRRPDLIAKAIGRLARDRQLAGALGRQAREAAAARFSAERMVDEVAALYGRVLAARGRAAGAARHGAVP